MRQRFDTSESMDIEIEVPSLAFFAESATPEAPGESEMVAASLAEVGALVPGRDPWTQATSASVPTVEGVRTEDIAGARRFQFRAPLPPLGQSHAFMLSVSRTCAALDGSGTRRASALHPTEQVLIRVTRVSQSGRDDTRQAPLTPIPDRQGAGRVTPGVNDVRAVVSAHDESAPTDGADALTLEIPGA